MTDTDFREAVEAYADGIFRLAYSYLRCRADAEDVMQETLLKLYTERRSFESPEHRRNWLFRVAVNECKHILRSPWRKRTEPLEEAEVLFAEPAQSDLFQEVMALPPKYRTALYLYYFEGYDVRETAVIMGSKPSTVQTWLMRGRGLLKTRLQEAEG